jgi:O-antigen/teichoic acid export membrane protein
LPAATGLTLIAPNLAPLLVGHDFVDSVIVLTPWMAAGAVLGAMRAQYFDFAFQLGRKTGYLVLILSLTAVLNVALNALLIPRYGEEGSAMALVFALVPSLTLAAILGRRVQPMPVPPKTTCQIIFAALVMAASITLVSRLHGLQGLVVQILVGVIVYAATLVAVNVLGIRSQVFSLVKQFRRSMRPSRHGATLREKRHRDA